eukprot:gene37641-46437_t
MIRLRQPLTLVERLSILESLAGDRSAKTFMHTNRIAGIAAIAAALAMALGTGAAMAAAPVRIAGKQLENLDRGVTAIAGTSAVFVSWRALATDPAGLAFNLYRAGKRCTTRPPLFGNWYAAGVLHIFCG